MTGTIKGMLDKEHRPYPGGDCALQLRCTVFSQRRFQRPVSPSAKTSVHASRYGSGNEARTPLAVSPTHLGTGRDSKALCSNRVVRRATRREGLQTPRHLFSRTRKFVRGERGSTKSSLMVEGDHISHHRTGRFPFSFNQSGKFTGCGSWRFVHPVSLHRANHASIELDDRKLLVRCRKMCGGPEPYPIPKHEEE